MTDTRDASSTVDVERLAKELLESAASDNPPSVALRATAVALGVSATALATAARAAALGQGAGLVAGEVSAAGAAGFTSTGGTGGLAAVKVGAPVAGGGLKAAALITLGKWVAGGFAVATLAVGGARLAGDAYAPSGSHSDGSARQVPVQARGTPNRGASSVAGVDPRTPDGSGQPAEQGRSPLGAPARALGDASLEPEESAGFTTGSSNRSAPAIDARAASGERETPDAEPVGPQVASLPGLPSNTDAIEPPPLPLARPTPMASSASFPSASAKPQSADDRLASEVRLLDAARADLAAGKLGPGLAKLDQYHAAFPTGALRAEALALTADMWLRAGNALEARRWVGRLEQAYPASQHLERFARLRSAAPADPSPPR